MGRNEEKDLDDLQYFFLRLAFGTGPGASKVALRFDTNTRSMKLRVWYAKIMLIMHI